ncbi:OmpH family outer membrane protein [Solemya velum gill symbiont]|uniref:Periplasmic chaperone for outer membrane proteins Skp n=1 Tax=Solemya velum gill symbiont TaxID=2340 RepID=A0A0B0HFA1_SOVGS|nr:OmpH family outer membrane protein [Solemya velum gill symbiont]KHF26151.1 periplasmic chaperone for outer membrane proteins Skp [Solemya velum gill symbiont]OOY35874.1 hypothetical protein BOV88_02180 [Solemya velum gill symbiont]OOY38714.1 hypothetical protein BOV89_00350 [Solemya velum gill symbiont]OOY38919.1 hypothetical protein BOV90_12080 [Solemya velum gill symbiont]OOY44886.1 hypothetical protein BOV91_00015 [Solemya velum gill symbiont]
MLKLTRTVLLALLFVQVSTASAETSHKVGFVNVPLIMKKSPQVAAIEEGLKQEYLSRNKVLDSRREKLKELEFELKDSGSLSFEDRTALERKVLTERRRLKEATSELDEDIAFKKTDEQNRLRILIAETIESIAREQSIDLVFEAAVVHASERADISNQVLERMQAAFEANKGESVSK